MHFKMVLSARFPGVHAVHDFAKKLSTHHWIRMWDEKDEGFNNASLMFFICYWSCWLRSRDPGIPTRLFALISPALMEF